MGSCREYNIWDFHKVTEVGSDVQGLVNPPRVRGWGQEGKGRGQDFMTLTQTPTLVKGWAFCESKSRVVNR